MLSLMHERRPTQVQPVETECPSNRSPSSEPAVCCANGSQPPPLSPYRSDLHARRHHDWHKLRQFTYYALIAAQTPLVKLGQFVGCGANAWLMRNRVVPSCMKLVVDTCKFRLCRPCAATRAALIRDNLTTHCKDRDLRFLTLTLKSADEPLRLTVARLHKHFRVLRRRILWRDRVTGGAGFVEVTRNQATQLWHVHLHCIVEGKYIPRSSLAAEWLAVTGDSYIIDIRRPASLITLANYVTKYVTKPFAPGPTTTMQDLILAAQALEGSKLASTFGTWRRAAILTSKPDPEWEVVEHTNMLVGSTRLTEHERTVALGHWALYSAGRALPFFTIPEELEPDPAATGPPDPTP